MAVTRLEQDVHIAQMLGLLSENGRQGDANNLRAVLGYIALMDKQLATVNEELRGVRQEMAALRQPRPAEAERQKLADRLQCAVQDVRKQLDAVKQTVITWARDAVAAAKQVGVTALDGALRTLHVRQGLEAVSSCLKNAVRDVDKTAARIASINARYRQAGKHLRNFGRAIRGQAPIRRVKPEGKLSRGVQAVFGGMREVLSGVARDADAALERLGRLEQATARPSMLGSVQALKEAAAKQTPQSKSSITQEASL